MNSLEARVKREQRAHDDKDVLTNNLRIKKKYFPHLTTYPSKIRLYQKIEDTILDDIKDKRILDYGCGTGENSLKYLQKGAYVDGIDISSNYIRTAEQNAHKAGFSNSVFNFKVMDAHNLEFGESVFDYVVGTAILHHLDIGVALEQIHKVLKPGGSALFIEPVSGNPLFTLARKLTPNARTEDETPLSMKLLNSFKNNPVWSAEMEFAGSVSVPFAFLSSLLFRNNSNNFLLQLSGKIESYLNAKSILTSWNQVVLLNFTKIK